MIQSVLPFLMFQEGAGAAALDYYRSVFPDAVLGPVGYYGEGEQGPAGGLKTARLTIAGQTIILFDSPVSHAFGFTPSISLFVECGTEDEVRTLSERLKEGGSEMMPLGNYGFSRLFAWVADRFGVSWQINCA